MREVWCEIVNSKIRIIKMYLVDSVESESSFSWRENTRRAARRRKLSGASHRGGLPRRSGEKEQNSAHSNGSWDGKQAPDPTETIYPSKRVHTDSLGSAKLGREGQGHLLTSHTRV